MPEWFETWPDRLEQELAALEEWGIRYTLDEEAKRLGVIRLDLELPDGEPWGSAIALTATFPREYPYFRPFVVSRDLSLPRHQHPFSGNLCLLGRSTLDWDIEETLAGHLAERLPKLRDAVRADPEALANNPHEQAEPFSDYYTYPHGSVVFVSSQVGIPTEATGGKLTLAVARAGGPFLRAALLAVRDDAGDEVANVDPRLAQPLGESRQVTVPWVRSDEPLRFSNAAEALEALGRDRPEVMAGLASRGRVRRGAKNKRKGKSRASAEVVGVVFPEEHAPGLWKDSWLFIIRDRSVDPSVYYARTVRSDASTVLARAPELAPLRKATVGLVGLGCVGAPIAFELLRAGVGTLRVLDHDFVDAGTAVRWPVGLSAAGYRKAYVLQQIAFANYPSSKVEPSLRRIGEAQGNEPEVVPPGFLDLAGFLQGLDLIIDASAEFGVQHYLADQARQAGIPFVHASGTRGGWGGLVFRVLPGMVGCWYCVRQGIEDGTLGTPPEAAEELGMVQPVGCADPTFTGSGFDLSHVSAQAVRVVVATLCREAPGYPDFDHDYWVLSMRKPSGDPVPAMWTSSTVPRVAACSGCGA